MATSTSQKFFSETCSLTERTPTSVASLMIAAGYGREKDANNDITTQPSLDGFVGSQCFIIPQSATVFVGHDQYVSNTALSGPPRMYKGVPAGSGDSYNVVNPERGIVDANSIWLFSTTTQEVGIVFVAT